MAVNLPRRRTANTAVSRFNSSCQLQIAVEVEMCRMSAFGTKRTSRVLVAPSASPVRLSEPHFDDQPRCNDAECSERSYDYAKDKLTGFAPSRLHRCVLKARILLCKPVLSLDTLFSRQVSHVADPKFVPDLGSTEALKASAILV